MHSKAVVYGVATGLAVLVTGIALRPVLGDLSDLTIEEYRKAEKIGAIRYLVIPLGIILAMLAHRRSVAGTLGYKEALVVGITAALACGVVVGITEAVFMAMNPEFMDAASRMMIENMRASGATSAEIDATQAQMESMAWMGTPLGMGVFYLFETSVLGTVVALVAGLFVRKRA